MKTRAEFVSNSSSCSFIVNDIAAFKAKLAELCRDEKRDFLDLWWLNSLSLNFSFDNCEESREAFKQHCGFYEYSYADENELPSEVFTSMTFDSFMDLDSKLIPLMKDVRVTSEDMVGDGIHSLAFLFYAMKAHSIDVDKSQSEQDFNLFNMSIPKKVMNAALNNALENNCL